MNQDELLQEKYEDFEGEVRKLDELIGQLELWSDVYTINHKKEEERLIQYVELHYNLEELKDGLYDFLEENREENPEKIEAYEQAIEQKIEAYQVTEDTIHNWIRDIKAIDPMIARSEVLSEARGMIYSIIELDQ